MKIGSKVMLVGSSNRHLPNVVKDWHRGRPVKNVVYVVSDMWDTSLGPMLFLIGFGSLPIYNGLKTGWLCKDFRTIEEIREE